VRATRSIPADFDKDLWLVSGASYTAIVRGTSNTNGIAVVEVYALQ
jgi:hypothetical protein